MVNTCYCYFNISIVSWKWSLFFNPGSQTIHLTTNSCSNSDELKHESVVFFLATQAIGEIVIKDPGHPFQEMRSAV